MIKIIKRYKLFTIGFVALTMVSCSDYNEVVKSDNYQLKLERANQLYAEGTKPKLDRKGNVKKYSNGDPKIQANTLLRSVTLYEQVYQRSPKSGEGEMAYFRIGKAYYLSGDYYTGGYYLGTFVQRFPFSYQAEEALFLSAMCSVQNSPETSLDQEETEIAINDLQQFVDRFPNSSLVDSCNHILDKLYLKLETKDYDAVKLYDKTMRYRAAVSAAITFLEDHPKSMYVEEVNYLLVKNSKDLAINSIDSKKRERIEETKERYRTFVASYPNSDYLKSISGVEAEMDNELKALNELENKN